VELEALETKHEQARDARHTKDTLDMEINTMANAKRNKPAGGHLLPGSDGNQMLRRGRGRYQAQGELLKTVILIYLVVIDIIQTGLAD
jgi:hypothetical protein